MKSFFKHQMSFCLLLVMILVSDFVSANNLPDPPPPPCSSITRQVTNAKSNNSDPWDDIGVVMNLLNTGNASWLFEAGAIFQENANGTGSLTGVIHQFGYTNRRLQVNIQFSDRSWTGPFFNQTGVPTTSWYVYNTWTGTMTGLGDLAGGAIAMSYHMNSGIQAGIGANQVWSPSDMTANGAGTWFEWSVVSQPSNTDYSFLNYSNAYNTDVNILLSGVPTLPCDPPVTVCDNVTNGGFIGSNQTICAGATPALLTNVTSPSGGSGTLEYIWLKSTTGCPALASQMIAGSTSVTYQSGPLTQTTYFRRCARRAGCTDYVGESNCITITVVPDVTPPTITGCPGNQTVTATGNCAVVTWTAPTASDNCSTPTLTSNYNSGYCFPVGTTTVVYTATDVAGLTKTCTFNVVVDPAPCVVSIDISGKVCNNNGTPDNPNDDTYTFVMTVVGAGNISGTWSGGYSNPYLGAFAFGPTPYNTPVTLGPFPAGPFTSGNTVPPITLPNGLDIQIDVQDSQNPACAQSTTVTSPGPCSNGTQPNCDNITITAAPGQITVGGLTAPIVMVQIFTSNWATVLNCAGNCNTPVQVVNNLTAGTYYVKVTFLTAGWSQICLKEVFIDVPPPPPSDITFICTNNISVDITSGTTTTVTYTEPTATTTCAAGGLSVVRISGPASGSAFPVGTTQVCYQATDACGNTKTCCFTVTVTVTVPFCAERVVTNNILCNGSTAYGLWINGNYYSTAANVRFRQYSDGTANLSGNYTRTGESVVVNINFSGFNVTGTPFYDLCVNSGGAQWDFYNNFSGTLSINGTSYAVTPRGPHLFQMGTGANLNEPSQFGGSTWFYLNNTIQGDFNFRLGPQGECTTTPPICDNVTSGGTIGSNQSSNCGPFVPTLLTNITYPSGGSGALEYIWLSSTTGCPNSLTQTIPGANAESYQPGLISQTTYFRRCVRRVGCTDYIGESNCITITVAADNTPPTISGCPSNISLTTNSNCAVATWTAPTAADNCGIPVLTSNYNSGHCFPVGSTTVIYTATDASGLTATCTFTVTVVPPPCVERVVTNNILCNGSTAYGLWINGNYYNTSANVRFRQYSDGTATLTGNFTRTGETAAVNLTLTGFSDTGTPYYELCVNSGGSAWDFYNNFSGTLSINGTSYAVTPRGPHLFQMGTGANLNEPAQFGASTWFFLNNTIHGDFNFRLGPAGECTTTTVCDNVTSGGTISKTCVNGQVSLNNVTLPTGGSGTIEYVWMKGTSGCSVSSMTAVANSNSATLTVASPSVTTYYLRCSRRAGCTSYDGESNCITVYANECAPVVCNNVTNGGTISKSCVNGQVSLNSVTLPTGGSGTIEYVWMKGTSGCSVSSMTAVANSNSATLTVASPSVTTYYIRCSRRAGCTPYDGESNCITVNANECAPVVCSNVTNGGTISKSCVNGQVSLNSVTLPTGGSGTIEYVWMKGTSGCSVNSMTAVANSNSATLTVASPSVTTYYIRCSRRAGCTPYDGESNCITVNANECNTTNCTGNILFVANSTSLNGSDLAMKNRLISLGYTVTVKSHSYASSADASGKVLVIISESVTSTAVNSKFKSVTVPVMVMEPYIYDDMKMTGSSNLGAINITSMYINTGHPIATGLSGNTTVYTSSQSAAWGTPSSSAAVIAYNSSYTYKKYVFAYESGASMSGFTAPAKRIGFFVGSNCATYLTANGWKLFDQAVKWATGCPIGGQNLQAEVPVSDFNATREFRQSRIEWATNTGYRNDYAVVERLNEVTSSFDAIDYIETGTPDNHPHVFTAYDTNPNEGDNFYRLKLVFTDGTEEYSEVKKVNFDGLDKVNIFPNPAVDVLMVDLTPYAGKQVTIFLYNQLGQPMESIEVDAASAEPRSIDISQYISGTYLVRVTTAGRRDVTKQVTINR